MTNKATAKSKYKKYHSSRGSWGNVNPITKIIPDKKKEKNKKNCRKPLDKSNEV